MTAPLAVFRADSGRSIGTGHVMRCSALAEFMSEAGWRCFIAESAESSAVSPSIAGMADRIMLTADGPANEAAQLKRTIPGGCDLFVIDHYARDAGHERSYRGWARRILAIDDLANRAHDCDFLLDQTPRRRADDYAGLVPASCSTLLGPAFALLRRQFMAARHRSLARRRQSTACTRVLISFGGVDAGDHTSRALEAVAAAAPELAVDVVMGPAAPHLAAVRARAGRSGSVIRVHTDVRDMAALAAAADIAIGAAGTSSWERACLGVPSIALAVADNQRLIAAALERLGCAIVIPEGAAAGAAEIAQTLRRLLADQAGRLALGEGAADLCDGRGAWRTMLRLLPDERGRSGETMRLRLAERGDSDLMFAWQAGPDVRRYARRPQTPSRAEHIGWVETSLANPERILTLILRDDTAVGVLRFDRLDVAPSYEISVLVDPRLQGQGIAAAALRLGQAFFRGATLHAEVDPENAASRRLFERAGFRNVDARRLVWLGGCKPGSRATDARAVAEATTP